MPNKTNHVLHLILTLLTCGLWGFVWITMVIVNSLSKDVVETYTTGQPQMPAHQPYPPQGYPPQPPQPPAPGYGPQYPQQ
jgi:hypothetical protein